MNGHRIIALSVEGATFSTSQTDIREATATLRRQRPYLYRLAYASSNRFHAEQPRLYNIIYREPASCVGWRGVLARPKRDNVLNGGLQESWVLHSGQYLPEGFLHKVTHVTQHSALRVPRDLRANHTSAAGSRAYRPIDPQKSWKAIVPCWAEGRGRALPSARCSIWMTTYTPLRKMPVTWQLPVPEAKGTVNDVLAEHPLGI